MKKAEKQSFIDVMESFTESYLPLEKGCVQNTIKSYKTTYGLLIDYLFDEKGIPSDSITFEQLDYAMLTSFLQWLQEKRGCGASTRNQRLAALNSFAKYAQNICLEAAFFRNSPDSAKLKTIQRL